ncbi:MULTISPECIES: ATP-binding cassette domain-containing protein [unclassified Nocardia]|uniref:ATP-binding cassette domain-containing protein n=1 Tax=unclassified Nocardia TaxID=2637762 RepID=UPI001CE459F5|nr:MULTISPECIES: ATP-binding cassette domain-containing protein [unclassified Nocardia]
MQPTSRDSELAILAEGLTKRFGKTVALKDVDLAIEQGTVCGLLGPNGAGKTTLVRILTTLLRPDSGTARVAGFDVIHEAERLRYRIGLAGQHAAVDELLTGRNNLEMVGRLYHLTWKAAKQRGTELLECFGLTDAADRPVRTYSGGMRRRLDLAASLVVAPAVLFLDEPTTGLDPRSRNGMWEVIADLVESGTTLLLTTQYLEEADRLADRIVVIDSGRLIAAGTPSELKAEVGGVRVDVVVRDESRLERVRQALVSIGSGAPAVDRHARRVTVPVANGATSLVEAVRELDAADIELEDIGLRRPTMDEVFLQLTGRTVDEREPVGQGSHDE